MGNRVKLSLSERDVIQRFDHRNTHDPLVFLRMTKHHTVPSQRHPVECLDLVCEYNSRDGRCHAWHWVKFGPLSKHRFPGNRDVLQQSGKI